VAQAVEHLLCKCKSPEFKPKKKEKEREREREREGGKLQARHWWLTPVILATQEAEIRRIMV
jgi:hypothetical protein